MPLIIILLLTGCSISNNQNILFLQANIEIITEELDHKKNNLKDFMTNMDGEISLLEKEIIFDVEQFIVSELIELNNEIITLEEKTNIGFSKSDSAEELAFLGRNQISAPDQFVNLQEGFIFLGANSSTNRFTAGQVELKELISSKKMSANFAGLHLPNVIETLAKSMNISIYLSPSLQASKEPVFLKMQNVDTLDILEILLDEYSVTLAYDIELSIARFFNEEEFDTHMIKAIRVATAHNQIAKIHKNKKELIFQKNELLEFYENYLQPSKHTPQLGFQTYLDMNVSLQSGLSSSLLQIKEMIFKGQMKIIEKKASYGEELRKLSIEVNILYQKLEALKAELAKASQ